MSKSDDGANGSASHRGWRALVERSARALHGVAPQFLVRQAANHLLADAVERADNEAVGAALKLGADPNVLLATSTALDLALMRNEFDVAMTLIEAGANPNLSHPPGVVYLSALHLACDSNWAPGVKALIDKGADINAVDHMGLRPIDRALGNHDALRALVSAGADLNTLNPRGEAPLHRCLRQGSGLTSGPSISRLLLSLSKGMSMELPAKTAMLLIELGADPLMREGFPDERYLEKMAFEDQPCGKTPLEIMQSRKLTTHKSFDWLEPLVLAEQARRAMQAIARLHPVSKSAGGLKP